MIDSRDVLQPIKNILEWFKGLFEDPDNPSAYQLVKEHDVFIIMEEVQVVYLDVANRMNADIMYAGELYRVRNRQVLKQLLESFNQMSLFNETGGPTAVLVAAESFLENGLSVPTLQDGDLHFSVRYRDDFVYELPTMH